MNQQQTKAISSPFCTFNFQAGLGPITLALPWSPSSVFGSITRTSIFFLNENFHFNDLGSKDIHYQSTLDLLNIFHLLLIYLNFDLVNQFYKKSELNLNLYFKMILKYVLMIGVEPIKLFIVIIKLSLNDQS